MRRSLLIAVLLLGAGCSSNKLPSEDREYVNLTLDLMRARIVPSTEHPDSIAMKSRLAAVFLKHSTTEAKYKALTEAMTTDPKRVERISSVLKDSLKIQ